MRLSVLHRGKEYVIVHKPAGLITYGERGEQSAQTALERQLGRKVFPVHRLDKLTCGLLVFALTPERAAQWTNLFRGKGVQKIYTAIVHGVPEPQKGTWNEPLPRHKEKDILEPARTDYRVLGSVEIELAGEKRQYSLLECEPKTGRYHQIRRHCRKAGHPIVGDPDYGNAWDLREFKKKFGLKRTLLSATELFFHDPLRDTEEHVRTRPDPDFMKICRAFRWAD